MSEPRLSPQRVSSATWPAHLALIVVAVATVLPGCGKAEYERRMNQTVQELNAPPAAPANPAATPAAEPAPQP